MQFSCTKKVLDQMKKHRPVQKEKVEPNFYNWYVDLINLERKNYFLFTHSLTLFSFFIYCGTKQEKENLEDLFKTQLIDLLSRELALNPKPLGQALFDEAPFTYQKTNSRSVLGSMTDLKFQIQVQLAHRGPLDISYDLINHLINRVPMSPLKYQKPVLAMQKELEDRGLKRVDPSWN